MQNLAVVFTIVFIYNLRITIIYYNNCMITSRSASLNYLFYSHCLPFLHFRPRLLCLERNQLTTAASVWRTSYNRAVLEKTLPVSLTSSLISLYVMSGWMLDRDGGRLAPQERDCWNGKKQLGTAAAPGCC